jgi:glycosyltransferase involved in cell wall biosynthesis
MKGANVLSRPFKDKNYSSKIAKKVECKKKETETNMSPIALFISPGVTLPKPGTYYYEKFFCIGRYMKGFSICGVQDKKNKTMETGGYTHYFFNAVISRYRLLNIIINTLKCYKKARRLLNKKKNIQVIISTTPFFTALAAIRLGKKHEKKVLLEINGCFDTAFKFNRVKGPTWYDRFKERIGKVLIEFSINHVDAIKLLYENQIDCYHLYKEEKRITVFHDFVPISKIKEIEPDDKQYILTLGYPWYLKGVDIIIKAFKRISNEFPQYKLKVYGWCPKEKTYFENMAKDCDSIEIGNAVFYDEAIKLISQCTVFILASRTEAMGRVLLEAMACKKPVVASRVGGIPSFVKHRYNGLLFEPENHNELSVTLRQILIDPKMISEMGKNGYYYVNKYLSEKVYAEKYEGLLKSLFNSEKPDQKTGEHSVSMNEL